MGLFNFKQRKSEKNPAVSAQTVPVYRTAIFNGASFYPLAGKTRAYLKLRQEIPIIDAAINKLVRLTEGFHFETGNEETDMLLNSFMESINVGGNQQGINAFASNYLNQLLTFGTAVGEIVLGDGAIYALYNSRLDELELKRAANSIDVEFYSAGKKIASPQLILYSVLNPKPDELCGTSLLDGLDFVSDILMKIYRTIGENWEHAGNVRYAVTCKNSDDDAPQRANEIATAWSEAMNSESVKDFVAVGDVSVSVIGADNKVLESEIPVRQLLEQIVAKTGLPPFMLGLSWSTTERMSSQQADILTTELEAYRRILTPVLKKIANLFLTLQGHFEDVEVVWNDITLQDECEQAKAQLYLAQAEKLREEATV